MSIASERLLENWNVAPDTFTIDFLEFLSACEIPEMSSSSELQQFLIDYHITEHLGRIGFFDSRRIDGYSSDIDPLVRLYKNNGFLNLTGRPAPWETVALDYQYEISLPIYPDYRLDTRLLPRADIMKGIHMRRGAILEDVQKRVRERQELINEGIIERSKFRPGVNISEAQLAINAAVYAARLQIKSDEILSYYPAEFTRTEITGPRIPIPDDQKRSHDPQVFIMALQQGLQDLSSFLRDRQEALEVE